MGCDVQVNKKYMNELRLYPSESDLLGRMTEKGSKELKLLLIPMYRLTFFLFGNSGEGQGLPGQKFENFEFSPNRH